MSPNKKIESEMFLLSSHSSWSVDVEAFPYYNFFKRLMVSWGIGVYGNDYVNVIKSEVPKNNLENKYDEFKVAMNATVGKTIICKYRMALQEGQEDKDNPLKLNFLGYDWLMTHDGEGKKVQQLVPFEERLFVRNDSDCARTFEFLRTNIIEYVLSNPKRSLIEACRYSYSKLLDKDTKGKHNIILTNGTISFCFVHWKPLYLYYYERDNENIALISTEKPSENIDYAEFNPLVDKQAKMLVICGHTLIFNGDIPR